MNEKNEIINIFKDLVSKLKKHNKYYYVDDSPKITDSEYDLLKKKIMKLEDQYSFLQKIGSISNIIGARPSSKFKKVKHLLPMLSLSNAFDDKDIEDFLKKLKIFLI